MAQPPENFFACTPMVLGGQIFWGREWDPKFLTHICK